MSAGAAGVAVAAMIQAVKASGVIVRVDPEAFLEVLQRQPGALVVHATGGVFRTNDQYLTSYKGLAFFTKAPETLELPYSADTFSCNLCTWRHNSSQARRSVGGKMAKG